MKMKTHYPTYTLTFEDALYYRDINLLRDLLDKGRNPDRPTKGGDFVIIEALKRGLGHFVELLKERGVPLDTYSAEGNTAFTVALPHHPTWRLEEWWPQADVNEPRHDGARPLHIAVEANEPELLAWLLERGADRDLTNAQGEPPLAYCRRLLAECTDKKDRAWLRDCERCLTEQPHEWDLNAYAQLLPELRAAKLDRESPLECYRAAMKARNLPLVRKLLEAGGDPTDGLLDVCNQEPCPEKAALVDLLLAHGANPSGAPGAEDTPLTNAIAFINDKQTVRRLLEAGANPYPMNWDGYGPLKFASSEDDFDIVNLLLAEDVDVNCIDGDTGSSALDNIIFHERRDLELAEEFLKRGAHPFTIPAEGHACTTMVMLEEMARGAYAFEVDEQAYAQQVLALLYKHFPFLTPLRAEDDIAAYNLLNAAAYGLENEVDFALRGGASPDAANSKGESALYLAARYGHEQVVYTLLRYGANPNVMPSPLAAALRGKGKRTERMVQLLLGFGANPNGGGQPTLQLARTPQLIRLLLAAGAQVNASTDSPAFVNTPLHLHARRGKTACVQVLLEVGADTEQRNIHGMTALHLAVARGNMECVRALLAAGADINAPDRHGNTPLMTAFSHRRLPIFRELLQAGADTSIQDCGGRSIADDIRCTAERGTTASWVLPFQQFLQEP